MIEAASLSAINAVSHGFFTREGGVSDGIYASLNAGYGSDDDKAKVAENRNRIARTLGVDAVNLMTVWQCHSADVKCVDEPWDPLNPPKADAMVSTRAGVPAAILTADCTPVLFASGDGKVVGAAHAGWKGAFGGVLAATVTAMKNLGARDIHAAIGPTISQKNYEVGPEFQLQFVERDPESVRFFVPSPKPDHHMFDLPGFVRAHLEGLGLASIEDTSLCTYADEQRFFSYRRTTHRSEPDYGRQLSAISIRSK